MGRNVVWLKRLFILWVLVVCNEFYSVTSVNAMAIPFCYGVGCNVLKIQLKCIVCSEQDVRKDIPAALWECGCGEMLWWRLRRASSLLHW